MAAKKGPTGYAAKGSLRNGHYVLPDEEVYCIDDIFKPRRVMSVDGVLQIHCDGHGIHRLASHLEGGEYVGFIRCAENGEEV